MLFYALISSISSQNIPHGTTEPPKTSTTIVLPLNASTTQPPLTKAPTTLLKTTATTTPYQPQTSYNKEVFYYFNVTFTIFNTVR